MDAITDSHELQWLSCDSCGYEFAWTTDRCPLVCPDCDGVEITPFVDTIETT